MAIRQYLSTLEGLYDFFLRNAKKRLEYSVEFEWGPLLKLDGTRRSIGKLKLQ